MLHQIAASFPSFVPRRAGTCFVVALLLALAVPAGGHIVPPETLHPAVESHRRLGFFLALRPVPWDGVASEVEVLAAALAAVDPAAADGYRGTTELLLEPFRNPGRSSGPADGETEAPGLEESRHAALRLFAAATAALRQTLDGHLRAAQEALGDHRLASAHFETARQLWAGFEHEIRSTDPEAYRELGACWLEMSSALGSPGLLGAGVVAPEPEVFAREAGELREYLVTSYDPGLETGRRAPLLALPSHSPTFDPGAAVAPRLPPGSRINKQLPRPRQVLNMASRGVDERETPLVALGDMAFDSPLIFGEPARSLGISCNTCHNKSITNPDFFIPGLSSVPGGLDVSSAFFAPHANNGLFDPLDIPDLRGLRFTAPYGRNGRFHSLHDFTRNVIVNEFDGPEPDPMLLDGLVAYMLEFDFLPNPDLLPDGRLAPTAPAAAKRGELLFQRPFDGLGQRSCATCHVPSDHFLDRRRHDIGSVAGAEPASRDRALDTPTLLGIAHTPPYFHDGSLPTLGAVVEWFDEQHDLGLAAAEKADLTAYLETVGRGVDAYEDTVHTLEAELEEFSFFLSAIDHLEAKEKVELVDTTLRTVALELRAHKWDVQDPDRLPLLDRMAELVDAAAAARRQGDREAMAEHLAEYHRLYAENREVLR